LVADQAKLNGQEQLNSGIPGQVLAHEQQAGRIAIGDQAAGQSTKINGQTAQPLSHGISIAGTTLTLGAPAITVSGTPISLGSSVLVIGTSTIPMETEVPDQITTLAG